MILGEEISTALAKWTMSLPKVLARAAEKSLPVCISNYIICASCKQSS
ncbi:hypothetical protein APHMUC_0306 [Anaplasma phagocytophilum str. ApMUC09]|uniref:Uncharacterized protein n=1 Tax=Anaplasma phagocytophilum str. ApMUC09 TaxID=1359152 RepID=A0A0F3NA17_ANAPH|nr:hypothetical protein APHMUC_0306 [Anaplasma phagocytophilum str. ApMUC09]